MILHRMGLCELEEARYLSHFRKSCLIKEERRILLFSVKMLRIWNAAVFGFIAF